MNGSKSKLVLLTAPLRLTMSADGRDVVSHAGVGLLREVAALSGGVRHIQHHPINCDQPATAGVGDVLADTYKGC